MAKIAVAPLVGAWIEIDPSLPSNITPPSLPSWERGLKYGNEKPCFYALDVAPLVGAWIEILGSNAGAMGIRSLPSWERGLKFLSEYS